MMSWPSCCYRNVQRVICPGISSHIHLRLPDGIIVLVPDSRFSAGVDILQELQKKVPFWTADKTNMSRIFNFMRTPIGSKADLYAA